MDKKQLLFTNYKIPETMVPFVKIQDALSVLDESNFKEVLEIISKNITSETFYEELVLQIIRFTQIRRNFQYYALLTKELFSILGSPNYFREIVYYFAKGLYLRALYLAGVFSLEDVENKCKKDISQYFYFAPELGIPRSAQEITAFGPIYTRLGVLRKDNWLLYNDLLQYGYEKNTLRYALKYDDIEFLKEATKANDWTYSKKLFSSPFEPSSPMSLLAFAAKHGSIQCFYFLLENGAKITQEVIDAAISSGNMELFKVIQSNTSQFRHSLITASKYFHMEIANWLLMNTETSDIFLDNLIETCNYRIVLYFAQPSDIVYSIGTWTPLSRAAVNGLLSLCTYFVGKGAQINPTKIDAFTPLHAAAQAGYLEVCRYLVMNGADINPKDDNNNSPLYLAAEKNNYNVVDFLLSKGAPINQGNEEVLFTFFLLFIFSFFGIFVYYEFFLRKILMAKLL